MKKASIVVLAGALLLSAGTHALADHHEKAEGAAEMPPMGPPEEMKLIEKLNGEYAVKFRYKMDPMKDEWTETDATVELSSVAGGGSQQMNFEGELMGMPFSGVGLMSYDRETGKWQSTWVDSMAGRITMYTGDYKDGKIVVEGEDVTQGMTFKSRLTTYDITDDGFEWKYEMSLDGETYLETAKASYTRR